MSETPVASPTAGGASSAGAPSAGAPAQSASGTAATPDVLATIVAATRRSVEVRRELKPARVLESEAQSARPNGAAFSEGLSRTDRFNVIAECKRRSPSRGVLRADYDPAAIASAYARAGAAAISVLTEPSFFDGSLDHLSAVRRAVNVPILRKDFIVDEYQVLEAVAAGADALLLIVAALEPEALAELYREARAVDVDVLVEIHDERELQAALEVEADLLGINNRDLADFTVDLDRTYDLLSGVPAGKTVVSESGFSTREQLDDLERVGVDAVLIGETLMRADDIEAACRALSGTLI